MICDHEPKHNGEMCRECWKRAENKRRSREWRERENRNRDEQYLKMVLRIVHLFEAVMPPMQNERLLFWDELEDIYYSAHREELHKMFLINAMRKYGTEHRLENHNDCHVHGVSYRREP